MIEYRVCWNASSNISFEGHTDWVEWGGGEETVEEVEIAAYEVELAGHPFNISLSLGEALETSGFNHWVEVREV